MRRFGLEAFPVNREGVVAGAVRAEEHGFAMALLAGEEPGTLVVDPIAIDTELATGILDGSQDAPPGVDVKERLELAQSGC
ncbi:MAG: hypothetical protein ACR2NT_16650 [Acidimicrobiia bacterium]